MYVVAMRLWLDVVRKGKTPAIPLDPNWERVSADSNTQDQQIWPKMVTTG